MYSLALLQLLMLIVTGRIGGMSGTERVVDVQLPTSCNLLMCHGFLVVMLMLLGLCVVD